MATGRKFLFYESIMDTADRISENFGKEKAYDFLVDVIDFGLLGVYPDEDSPSWLYGFDTISAVIQSAQENYDRRVEAGKRGGRPKSIPEEDMRAVYQEVIDAESKGKTTIVKRKICEKYNCSVRTLNRLLKEFRENFDENQGQKVLTYDAETRDNWDKKDFDSSAQVGTIETKLGQNLCKKLEVSSETRDNWDKSWSKPNKNINNYNNTNSNFVGGADKIKPGEKSEKSESFGEIEWEF